LLLFSPLLRVWFLRPLNSRLRCVRSTATVGTRGGSPHPCHRRNARYGACHMRTQDFTQAWRFCTSCLLYCMPVSRIMRSNRIVSVRVHQPVVPWSRSRVSSSSAHLQPSYSAPIATGMCPFLFFVLIVLAQHYCALKRAAKLLSCVLATHDLRLLALRLCQSAHLDHHTSHPPTKGVISSTSKRFSLDLSCATGMDRAFGKYLRACLESRLMLMSWIRFVHAHGEAVGLLD